MGHPAEGGRSKQRPYEGAPSARPQWMASAIGRGPIGVPIETIGSDVSTPVESIGLPKPEMRKARIGGSKSKSHPSVAAATEGWGTRTRGRTPPAGGGKASSAPTRD